MFADVTKCYRPIGCPSDCLLLQRDLDSISEWSVAWNLFFNSTKCAALHFSRSPLSSSSTNYLNGDSISDMVCHRDLGVIMSKDLSWSNHYDYISAKAYKTLGLIRCSFHHTSSIPTKRALYMSIIRPQILYGSQIWHPHLIKDITKTENIQRRASKFILNDFLSDYKSCLPSLHILPLMLSMELNDIILMVDISSLLIAVLIFIILFLLAPLTLELPAPIKWFIPFPLLITPAIYSFIEFQDCGMPFPQLI